MFEWRKRMAFEDMDDLHLRIARVTEDLRTIQQELNCAAMQAPSDPELMEALNSLSETEPIETLRVALDQMRHFLWFYSQVMNNEPELGDKLRQAGSGKPRQMTSPKRRVLSWISFRAPMNSCCCIIWRKPNVANRTKLQAVLRRSYGFLPSTVINRVRPRWS